MDTGYVPSQGETDPGAMVRAIRQLRQNAVSYVDAVLARVYLSADQGGNAVNAYTKISFDTVDYDSASIWDSANKRFIPRRSGTFWAVCACEVVPSLAYAVTQAGASGVSKNGTRIQGQTLALWSTGGSGETFVQTGSLIQVNGTTDYIEGLGGALAASGTCTFKGALSSGTTLSINWVGP